MWDKKKLDQSAFARIQYVPLTQLDKILLADHIKELIEDF